MKFIPFAFGLLAVAAAALAIVLYLRGVTGMPLYISTIAAMYCPVIALMTAIARREWSAA